MLKRSLLASLLVTLIAGCDQYATSHNYQLLATPDGKVYRLDEKTGVINYVSTDGIFTLSEGIPKLKQGQYFQLEDGKFLKYLGNGQFEKSEWAARKVN